jgi:predicted DCC family thiol-disulfide oxidoreductase YuxK
MERRSVDRRERRILLYDGECGLCSRIVQVVLRADSAGTLRFASLQGELARELLARHVELNGVDSMAWVEASDQAATERVFIRSEGAIRLGRYLGFPWRLVTLARLLPAGIRDRLYDWVARHRRRWFGPAPSCPAYLSQYRDRFENEGRERETSAQF